VDDIPGVTRDRLYAYIEWNNKRFILVDTAGLLLETEDPLESGAQEQVDFAIQEATAIIFLVDAKAGLHPEDKHIASLLRKSGKPVFLAVNKVDGARQELALPEFYELGLDKVYPLSAIHGAGIRELMEDLIVCLPDEPTPKDIEDETTVRIAIVGRPNVGKSTLVNKLVGFPRVMVSEIPGTTRDAVDIELTVNNRRYIIVDTPGVRRKGRVKEKLEKISVIKALESVQHADIAVLLINAEEGPTDQDLHIGGFIQKRYKGCIICINKWDLVQKDKSYVKFMLEDTKRRFQFLPFAPMVTMSAHTGKNVNKLLPLTMEIFKQYVTRVNTGLLNRTFRKILAKHPPPARGGRMLKFYYITQPEIRPPTFVLFCNRPEDIHFSYERYLVNRFREAFHLERTPIRLIFRGRSENEEN